VQGNQALTTPVKARVGRPATSPPYTPNWRHMCVQEPSTPLQATSDVGRGTMQVCRARASFFLWPLCRSQGVKNLELSNFINHGGTTWPCSRKADAGPSGSPPNPQHGPASAPRSPLTRKQAPASCSCPCKCQS